MVERQLGVPRNKEALLNSEALQGLRKFFWRRIDQFDQTGNFFIISTDFVDIASMRDGNLGANNLMGNKRLYRKLLLDFGANYTETAGEIRQALDANDFDQAHSLVHNIKGLAGNLAATDLQAAAVELEKLVELAEDFDFEVIGELVSELEQSANS